LRPLVRVPCPPVGEGKVSSVPEVVEKWNSKSSIETREKVSLLCKIKRSETKTLSPKSQVKIIKKIRLF
jgi:hypothetical protein